MPFAHADLAAAAIGGGLIGYLLAHTKITLNRPPPADPQTPGDMIMTVKAALQAQIDRLTPLPAAINAASAAAVKAALAASDADDAEGATALAGAVDAVVAAATPPTS